MEKLATRDCGKPVPLFTYSHCLLQQVQLGVVEQSTSGLAGCSEADSTAGLAGCSGTEYSRSSGCSGA